MPEGKGRGDLKIIWRGVPIGALVNLDIDHSHWSGTFCAEASPQAEAFAKLAAGLEFWTTLKNPKLGTRVELWPIDPPSTQPIHALVMQLFADGLLSLKHIYGPEAIGWLLREVY